MEGKDQFECIKEMVPRFTEEDPERGYPSPMGLSGPCNNMVPRTRVTICIITSNTISCLLNKRRITVGACLGPMLTLLVGEASWAQEVRLVDI